MKTAAMVRSFPALFSLVVLLVISAGLFAQPNKPLPNVKGSVFAVEVVDYRTADPKTCVWAKTQEFPLGIPLMGGNENLNTNKHYAALGKRGFIVVRMEKPFTNGSGADIRVYATPDPMYGSFSVSVSADGGEWIEVIKMAGTDNNITWYASIELEELSGVFLYIRVASDGTSANDCSPYILGVEALHPVKTEGAPVSQPTHPSSPTAPPLTTTPSPTTAPSPSTTLLSADVVQLDSYRLRMVPLIQCASPQGRPNTSILISKDGAKNWVVIPSVLLDSGADLSMFPKPVADALGIDISKCPSRTLSGVGGTTTAYFSEVYIAIVHFGGVEADVDGYILSSGGKPFVFKVAATFSTDEANADNYILGREDVFDYLSLSFQGDTATVTVSGR
jgi:hypothetical protein